MGQGLERGFGARRIWRDCVGRCLSHEEVDRGLPLCAAEIKTARMVSRRRLRLVVTSWLAPLFHAEHRSP